MSVHKRKNDDKTLKGNVEYGNDLKQDFCKVLLSRFKNEREEIEIHWKKYLRA